MSRKFVNVSAKMKTIPKGWRKQPTEERLLNLEIKMADVEDDIAILRKKIDQLYDKEEE